MVKWRLIPSAFWSYKQAYHTHLKLRLGLRHPQLRLGPPLLSPKLRKDCQTRVNFRRVIQLSVVDQLDTTGDLGMRTLKLMFKALIASISVSVKSNEVLFRLDCSLFSVFVLGMTAMPFCVAQRR